MTGTKKRLLFFDLIRISSVLGIIVFHVCHQLGLSLGNEGYFLFFDWGLGPLAVLTLLFVSGAVIEYTYKGVVKGYAAYLYKRFVRMYPAFWMSLILGVVLTPTLLSASWAYLGLEFSGFTAFAGCWGGSINGPAWFVGSIVALYAMYPAISWALNKWKGSAMLAIALTSVMTGILSLKFGIGDENFIRWFPLCTMAYFALGVYVVKAGAYPAFGYDNAVIAYASELSFYAFLMHGILGIIQLVNVNVILYGVVVLLLSAVTMALDRMIQEKLKVGFVIPQRPYRAS